MTEISPDLGKPSGFRGTKHLQNVNIDPVMKAAAAQKALKQKNCKQTVDLPFGNITKP